MLLGSQAKSGKTCAAVLTAPKPVYVFNTDGRGGLDPAAALGGDFAAEDISDQETFDRAMSWLKAHIKEFRTVVFDNITNFGMLVEEKLKRDEKYRHGKVLYPEITRQIMHVINGLRELPLHVVVIGHLEPGENGVPGGFDHMLGLSGKARTLVGAVLQDWVWLNVENDPNVPGGVRREFLLAPQGNWTKGVRSIQHVKRMKADVSEFIRLMSATGNLQKPSNVTNINNKGTTK